TNTERNDDHSHSLETLMHGKHCETTERGDSHNGIDVFPIEQLPQELVRMIVECAPWATNRNLRASSHQFKQYVDEWMWKPRTYTIVTQLDFTFRHKCFRAKSRVVRLAASETAEK
ncbi:hypothetical protein PMAYCL1PPCAC_20877, partial [Pristionchus mayeri]